MIPPYERGRGMNAHCEAKLKNPRATPHRRTRPSARIIKRRLSHGLYRARGMSRELAELRQLPCLFRPRAARANAAWRNRVFFASRPLPITRGNSTAAARLDKFPQVVSRLKGVLERFANALSCIDQCFIADDMLEQGRRFARAYRQSVLITATARLRLHKKSRRSFFAPF